MQDANYNVVALFDNSGNVVERYAYDPFGGVTVLDADWNVRAASDFAWLYLHQGGRFDSVSGLYHFRHRDYSPTLGRWTSLDPIRYAAGDVNLYRALGNGLANFLDPLGLAKFKIAGYVFYVHENDPDPFPSNPHAHIGGPNSSIKVDIHSGQIFQGGKATGDRIPKKVLERLRQQLRGRGLLGTALVFVLVTPDIVQAAQQGGVQEVAQAAGTVSLDTAIGLGSSAVVGLGVTTGAGVLGTSVTVGGAAVTSLAGATGVGGTVIVTAIGGYKLGEAIGHIHVGSQSIHDHIADGMIWLLDKLGLWD